VCRFKGWNQAALSSAMGQLDSPAGSNGSTAAQPHPGKRCARRNSLGGTRPVSPSPGVAARVDPFESKP
jgi:hypothetical protein